MDSSQTVSRAELLLSRAHAQGGKVISRVLDVVSTYSYRDLSTRKHLESIEFSKKKKNWLQCVPNRGTRSTSVRNSAFFLAIVATPMNTQCTMHTGMRFLLMRISKWPSTGKDRRYVLNNARDTVWLLCTG